jgi:effector-binding domain-containing protein
MNGIPEEVVKLAESGEVKVKITKPQEVAFAVHKGSYQKLGDMFGKLVQWINENGYVIVGPSVTVCYDDPRTTPDEERVNECPFPVRKRKQWVMQKDDWWMFWGEKGSKGGLK